MVQHATEGKKDVRSVNAGQGCSKLVYLTSDYSTRLHAALSLITVH